MLIKAGKDYIIDLFLVDNFAEISLELKINSSSLDFFNALASNTRLKIIECLMPAHKNIKELAQELQLSSTIIAKHIEILEQAKIIKCESVKANRGMQKICRVVLTDYHLSFEQYHQRQAEKFQQFEIAIGHYHSYAVSGTCGLASTSALIGICDDPRYFSHPEHYLAGILWFAHGEIAYKFPGFFFEQAETISVLEISLEICSEAPGINETFLSDIYFSLNGVNLGCWLSPGDFGHQKGAYTPKWWYLTEYGKLVTLKISRDGTFINQKQVSNIGLGNIFLADSHDAEFKIISPLETEHPGGINVFGKGFGNHDQGIVVKVFR